jgi:hypothetical protein
MSEQEKEVIRAAIRLIESEVHDCFAGGCVVPSRMTDALGMLRSLVGG